MKNHRYRSTLRWEPKTAREAISSQRPRRIIPQGTLPLLKITVPYFLRSNQLSNQEQPKLDKLDGQMETLGNIPPECINEMVKDKKLMQNIDLSREIRKNAIKMRIQNSTDANDIYEQTDKIAELSLTEKERSILNGGYNKGKNKNHLHFTVISKLMNSYRQIIHKRDNRYALSRKASELETIAKQEKDKTVAILEKLNSSNPLFKKQTEKIKLARSNTLYSKLAISQKSRIPAAAKNKSQIHYSRENTNENIEKPFKENSTVNMTKFKNAVKKLHIYKQHNYTVDGYEQLCNAAEHLCEAYKKGEGNKELKKYQAKFKEHTKQQLIGKIENTKEIEKYLKENSNQMSVINSKNEQLENAINEKVENLNKWLNS